MYRYIYIDRQRRFTDETLLIYDILYNIAAYNLQVTDKLYTYSEGVGERGRRKEEHSIQIAWRCASIYCIQTSHVGAI